MDNTMTLTDMLIATADCIAELVKGQIGDNVHVSTHCAGKNNGRRLLVTVCADGQTVAPSYDILPNLMEGKSLKQIADRIVSEWMNDARDAGLEITGEVKQFSEAMGQADTGRNYILSHVFCQMAGKKGNSVMAGMYPHLEFLDMDVFFRITASEDAEFTSTVLLTDQMMEHFGLNLETVMNAALKNRKHVDTKLSEVLKRFQSCYGLDYDDIADNPMIVLTAEDGGIFGASAILDHKVLRDVSEKLGGDFIILPSSVHDVLAVPYEPEIPLECYKDMVMDVNKDKVAPEDRLTDSVYLYSKETDEVTLLI